MTILRHIHATDIPISQNFMRVMYTWVQYR